MPPPHAIAVIETDPAKPVQTEQGRRNALSDWGKAVGVTDDRSHFDVSVRVDEAGGDNLPSGVDRAETVGRGKVPNGFNAATGDSNVGAGGLGAPGSIQH